MQVASGRLLFEAAIPSTFESARLLTQRERDGDFADPEVVTVTTPLVPPQVTLLPPVQELNTEHGRAVDQTPSSSASFFDLDFARGDSDLRAGKFAVAPRYFYGSRAQITMGFLGKALSF